LKARISITIFIDKYRTICPLKIFALKTYFGKFSCSRKIEFLSETFILNKTMPRSKQTILSRPIILKDKEGFNFRLNQWEASILMPVLPVGLKSVSL